MIAAMERKMKPIAIALGLVLLAATASPPPAVAAATGSRADPDRWICKSKAAVGSRLKRIRECATAQQWEEMELQERLGLMRKQINGDPGCNGGNSQSCHPERRGGKDTPW